MKSRYKPPFGKKIDLKLNSSLMDKASSEHSSLSSAIASERRFLENVNLKSCSTASSKFSTKSSIEKNVSSEQTYGSLTNLNSKVNHFQELDACPLSPNVEEPFSPRIHHFDSKESLNNNKQLRFSVNQNNNLNNNIKQVTYHISSSGSKSNNKITQINNKISNRILSRNNSVSEANKILAPDYDPIDLHFQELALASKSVDFKNRKNNEVPNVVSNAFTKIGTKMTNLIEQYKDLQREKKISLNEQHHLKKSLLDGMYNLVYKSKIIPYYGIDLTNNLGKILLNLGALDLILMNFSNQETLVEESDVETANECAYSTMDQINEKICKKPLESSIESFNNSNKKDENLGKELKITITKLLNECLNTENTKHLIENNYQNIPYLVDFCCELAQKRNSKENEQLGTGILQSLFEYNDEICKEILIKLNAIDTIIFECRTSDIQTLRNCVHCLANVCLFGGDECQQKLIEKNLLTWLFPLASHRDVQIKYFALLTITILVANKEIEGNVLKTGTLNLIEPFLLSNSPQELSANESSMINNDGFGQSKEWLKKFVYVLDSDREEAKNLSAFHFAMESFIKKNLGLEEIFREINAINSLKKVASSPFATASRFAVTALKCLGESVPHKLSQQVALWTINDVKEWIKQIDFNDYCDNFIKSKVDGDLLLKLTEMHLEKDIGLKNGLLRMRFLRELNYLKKIAEYSNCDTLNIGKLLNTIGEDYVQYTYQIIQSGIDTRTMQSCTKEQLRELCNISNEFHAENIINAFKSNVILDEMNGPLESIDAFISYRRLGGSQLASLLKVHLSLKGLKVFLDVEKLQAGKFHFNLLTSIKQAKHFILVLTPHSLDRCIDDKDCNDWVHKEIVEALQNKCNIIPITYDFEWPNLEKLPEDMKPIIQFNAVTWSHEYQEACVDKILRFMQEDEKNQRKLSCSNASFGTHGVLQTPTINKNQIFKNSNKESPKNLPGLPKNMTVT